MRQRLRQLLVLGIALSFLGIGVPAWSEDDPRSCNDLLSDDTPAYVVCTWMATPEEAADIARFWLDNDGQNMVDSGPQGTIRLDCTDPANTCAVDGDSGGDGEAHDPGDPDVEGAEDGGTPECQNGEQCYTDGSEVSAADKAAAKQSAAGQAATAAPAGTRLWIETELADDYRAGTLDEGVRKVAALAAAQPGVVGVRFTSQLGYNRTFGTAEEIDAFVAAAATALRQVVPGRKLSVHTLAPVLGCGANEACKSEIAKKYPLLDPDRVGAWLTKGYVDQLALDNALLGTEYATWKIDAAEAQRNQSIQIRGRAWDALAQVAVEDSTITSALTAEQATKALTDRVAAPLQEDAAETVTLWTRWQNAQGQVTRAYGEKWAASPAWDQLKKLGSVRARLATVYDPATPEVDLATDLKNLSEVFGQIYLHAA
ncbi:hypothetical protein MF672_006880 [Actinomadura sp. ATCC 31491]|uniref:Uncharacterized protein n=1 Tax=Actinomadura luzonensis TaxID=2805427 RepID=A0ABT0FME3_9ACTN|nr:hypothetical protein [Actinomadura luzonensis]MCK2213518.1 hypothetical protein [Actinomadura luzonensis]